GAIGHDRMLCNAHRMSESSVPRPSRLDRVADAVDAQRVGAAWGAWRAAGHQDHQIPLIAAADVLQGRATWRTMSSVCATSATTPGPRTSRRTAPAGLGPLQVDKHAYAVAACLACGTNIAIRSVVAGLAAMAHVEPGHIEPGGHQPGNQGQLLNKGSGAGLRSAGGRSAESARAPRRSPAGRPPRP